MTSHLENMSTSRISRRRFLERAAALGLGATAAVSLPSNAARASTPRKGGILRAALVGGESTNTLDPALFASQVPLTFGRCWAEQLLEMSPDGQLEPRLAESFEPDAKAKKWAFRIRKDVTFHNGKTLTPDDVVQTYRRHADPKSTSAALALVNGFETIAADGDNVIITLREPNVDLPYLLTDFHLMIQPEGGVADPGAGIGTGPYKVVANEPGIRHGGERYPGYWAPDQRGHADQIEILVTNDATARMAAMQSGQADIVNRIDPKVVDLMRRISGIEIRNVSGRGHYYMVAHCDAAPFDNNDLRMALKYAVDREALVKTILGGYGKVGNDTPVMDAYPMFDAEIEQRAYDPDRAAFHYRKSGHDGPITLRTSDVAFPGAVDTATLFQDSAAKAGITVDVRREPGDGYWSNVWNKQPFCTTFIFGRPTQDQVYSLSYLSSAEWNDTRFFRDDFDRLILGARGELNPSIRKEMYRDATMILRDNGGAIIPMFGDFIDATGPKVGGWIDNPNGELMGGQALIKCWIET
jgi:peptide/nickel transport system substrate-binding protein